MRRISLFIILVISLICHASAQERWEVIQTPFNGVLNSIFCLDTLNIWIAADSGKILYTSDLGESWELQTTGNNQRVYDVFFINENKGWAVEWKADEPPFGTYILRTTDGGKNWSSDMYRSPNVFLYTIYFLDSLYGLVGGGPSELAYTDDGGENWYAVTIIDTAGYAYFPVHKFKFYNDQFGFAVGGNIDIIGVIWKTEDSGQTWMPYGIGPDPIYDIEIFDSLNIYTLAGDLEKLYQIAIVRSEDGGNTWSYEEIERYGNVTAFSFRTPYEAWASLWFDYNILVTSDSGNTWNYYPLPDSMATFDVCFIDSVNGFMIGDQGKVLKYKPDELSGISYTNEFIPGEFFLFQNFPNPFNPSTTISWNLPVHSYVKMIVYDLLGNEIAILADGFLDAGIHKIEFPSAGLTQLKQNINRLASGVYFYKLISIPSDNRGKVFTQVKKMVLLK